MQQRQSGSAHVIIIVLLVIGLCAALAWIFWQNVQGKDQQAVASQNQKASTDAVPDTSSAKEAYAGERFTSAGGAFSLKVPNGWELMSNNTEGDAGMNYITTGAGIDGKMDYDADAKPVVTQAQIGGWGGFAEYFTIQTMSSSPEDGSAGTDFALNDGTVGKKTESKTQPRPGEEIYPTSDAYYSYRYLFKKGDQVVQVNFGVFEQSHDKYIGLVDDVVRSVQIDS